METKTLNISLPKNMVAKIDRVAKERFANRSEFIREALRAHLDDYLDWKTIFTIGERQAKKLELDEKDVLETVRRERQKKRLGLVKK